MLTKERHKMESEIESYRITQEKEVDRLLKEHSLNLQSLRTENEEVISANDVTIVNLRGRIDELERIAKRTGKVRFFCMSQVSKMRYV